MVQGVQFLGLAVYRKARSANKRTWKATSLQSSAKIDLYVTSVATMQQPLACLPEYIHAILCPSLTNPDQPLGQRN